MKLLRPSLRTEYAPTVTTLRNGVTVVLDRVPSVASAAFGVWVNAGTRDEPRGLAGIAHFVEHASFRRTKHRTTRRIARDFENVGAYANAYTTKEETCYYVRSLSDHLPIVSDTLADIITSPLFDVSDIQRERTIITEEIRSYEDEPEEYIFDVAERQLFGRHPLGVPIVGTMESISLINKTRAREFHKRHYHAGSLVVTVSGNFDEDNVLALIEKSFKNVARKQKKRRRGTPLPQPPTERILTLHTQQAHVLWHARTEGYRSKDRSALAILNVVLGDGMASRLNIRLRETNGIAYTASSQLQLFTDVGMLSAYAGLDPNKVGKGNIMIADELKKLKDNGIKASERKRAIEQLRSNKIMGLESLTSRMGLLGKGMMDEGAPENPFESIQEFADTTLDDVNDVAQRVCDPDQWNRLILMPQ